MDHNKGDFTINPTALLGDGVMQRLYPVFLWNHQGIELPYQVTPELFFIAIYMPYWQQQT